MSVFSFTLGTLVGVYIAQNYRVPNVKALIDMGLAMARDLEDNHSKPEKKERNFRKPEKDEDD